MCKMSRGVNTFWKLCRLPADCSTAEDLVLMCSTVWNAHPLREWLIFCLLLALSLTEKVSYSVYELWIVFFLKSAPPYSAMTVTKRLAPLSSTDTPDHAVLCVPGAWHRDTPWCPACDNEGQPQGQQTGHPHLPWHWTQPWVQRHTQTDTGSYFKA